MGFDVETPEACQYRIYYKDHMIGENEKLIITNNKQEFFQKEGAAMDMQELKQLIYKGEKVDVECKKAENSVPKSAYESYSAFANTKGGYIILGVKEDMKVIIMQQSMKSWE